MNRYVFSSSDVLDAKALTAAKKAARLQGAVVVKALAGTMLVELPPSASVAEVAEALPGWNYARERKTTRTPERRPLERAKAA